LVKNVSHWFTMVLFVAHKYYIYICKMSKDERINIRIEKDLKEKLFELAKKSKRKPTDYLILLIEQAIEQNIKL